MAEQVNNARIVQADDLRFEALYDDESGQAVSLGMFDNPIDASSAIDQERRRMIEAGPENG